MTNVEIEKPFKFNLNSVILLAQLSMFVIGGFIAYGAFASDRALDKQAVVQLKSELAEVREELRATRGYEVSIAVLRNDIVVIKESMARVERALGTGRP